MSWKYSPSYTARDLSTGRESSQAKFGFSSPRFELSAGGRQSRWSSITSGDPKSRNCTEAVEQCPVWAKTSATDNPSSIPRRKERPNISEEPRREIRAYRKAETKELSDSGGGRPYGRSLTSLSLGDGNDRGLKFRSRGDKTPECEKPSYIGNRQILYMPTATTKLLTRKYSNDLSPTTVNAISKSFAKVEKSDEDDGTITVVTRATSPTPKASSVYLRSRRSDYGLEKKVPKLRKRPEMAHKEVQTDREEVSLAKYSSYTDSSPRVKTWSSYGNTCGPKYSGRCNYGAESRRDQLSPRVGDCRRSVSREESEEPATPESAPKSLTSKPPASAKSPPASPAKESEKKTFVRRSPPASAKCAKTELAKNPNSPSLHSPPLQCKILMSETLQTANGHSGSQSPKVTINHCPDIRQTIDDVSSMSESSEEETSSDEETDPAPMTVKKSVTNFLQNIPGPLPQNPSRANLYQRPNTLGPPKVTFKKIESGERAWWMESPDQVPEGVARTVAKDRDTPDSKHNAGNFLSPPYMINRQFSRDKDWLRGSSENVAKEVERLSPHEERGARQSEHNKEAFGWIEANGFVHGGRKSQNSGGSESEETTAVRRRDQYSKSPDNFPLEDLNKQMKFNQHAVDERRYLTDFSRECSVKDLSQKLHNGLGSPLEEKNLLEPGDMSGMISKAKASLSKSKTKLDIKKSSSREMSPKVTDPKSEIDLYWKELADSMSRPLRLCDLDFTDLNTDDETDILGKLRTNGEVPPPPPMLILPIPSAAPPKPFGVPAPPGNAPQQAPRFSRTPAPPPVPQIEKNKKTVKLFWKEVKEEPATQSKASGEALIWNELVKVNVDTQKLEYLFESRAKDLMSKKQQEQNKNKEIIVLDPKRSNAINIGMTKLPPPRAIKTAILKMDSTVVNKEGIEKLLAMLPTEEEKNRIQEAQATNPDVPLGSAEQFLLTLASISELEARLRLWAFKLDFENSEREICEPLMDLKQGMEVLRGNKTFRAILSTLLSVGNFLNGYDVKGFQIEYLSKVPEVKDTVHKHSLLHHLCIIVMDKFPDSTDLYSEIGAVTRASKVDFDELASNIKKVEEECKLSWNYLKIIAKHEGHTAMKVKMSDFLADCAERIILVHTVHKRIINRFQKFAFWLGVPTNRISTTRPNEIFKIISEFALEYRTTRDRVLQQIKKMNRDKSRSRGYLSRDANDMVTRKMNSKEAKDDARLKQLLENDTACSENTHNASTWRRQRNNTKNLVLETKDDEEILETLIKTANQSPSARAAFKERRRSRVYGKYCK